MNSIRTFFTYTVFILLAFISLTAQAQRETDNWYFGKYASLNFNQTGVPISNLGSAMNTHSACSSISDSLGNLLFYTNGDTVWNRQHQIMGIGLQGARYARQSCIIIPKPG